MVVVLTLVVLLAGAVVAGLVAGSGMSDSMQGKSYRLFQMPLCVRLRIHVEVPLSGTK